MEDEETEDCHDHSHPSLLPVLNVNSFISDCDIFLQSLHILSVSPSQRLADKYL